MAEDKKITDITEKKDAVDTDLMVIGNAGTAVWRRLSFGNLWKWIAKKIAAEVWNELSTSDKTILGAISELNSKSLKINTGNTNGWKDTIAAAWKKFPTDMFFTALIKNSSGSAYTCMGSCDTNKDGIVFAGNTTSQNDKIYAISNRNGIMHYYEIEKTESVT